MRKVLVTAALAAAAMLAPGLVPEARADHEWLAIGHPFRVGQAHISFFFGTPGFGFGHPRPAYYYRYDRPIHYRGHRCSRYCFHDAGHYYHHDSCPLVRAHLRAYRLDPYQVFERHAPRHRGGHPGYDDWRYRDRRLYDRHGYADRRHDRRDRWDRDDSWDRDHRWDRDDRWRCDDRRGCDDRDDRRHRGRGRGHRHHRACGHG